MQHTFTYPAISSADYLLPLSLDLYKKADNKYLTKQYIILLFRELRRRKNVVGKNLFVEIARPPTEEESIGDTDFRISALCFLYKEPAAFLEKKKAPPVTKCAHLCILDFPDYVAITKSNLTLPESFRSQWEEIPVDMLLYSFLTEETRVESIHTTGLAKGETAIRRKSLTGADITSACPATGNSYDALRSLRLVNETERLHISLLRSHISGYGRRYPLPEFIRWVNNIRLRIAAYRGKQRHDFLQSFATTRPYPAVRDRLRPVGLMLMQEKLLDDILSGHLVDITLNNTSLLSGKTPALPIFSEVFPLSPTASPDTYEARDTPYGPLLIRKERKSISLHGAGLDRYQLHFNNGSILPMGTYLRRRHYYIVFFREHGLVYTAKTLYKYASTPMMLQHFQDVFHPLPALADTTGEKGNISPTSTCFEADSIFGLVEQTFSQDYDCFICDDLGNEWADHIGISEKRISFFVSKFHPLPDDTRNSRLAVSPLHIAVSQAQKNLALLTPGRRKLQKKYALWASDYPQSRIPRLRKGKSVQYAIMQWQNAMERTGVQQQMNIVINHLSYATICRHLQQYRTAMEHDEADIDLATIQLVHLISGLYTACQHRCVELRIFCRP